MFKKAIPQQLKKMKDDGSWPFTKGFENRLETKSPVSCVVQSSIPNWLSGTLLRVGPGVFSIETNKSKTFSFNHWFDG